MDIHYLIENGREMELHERTLRAMEEDLLVFECTSVEMHREHGLGHGLMFEGAHYWHLTPDFDGFLGR